MEKRQADKELPCLKKFKYLAKFLSSTCNEANINDTNFKYKSLED